MTLDSFLLLYGLMFPTVYRIIMSMHILLDCYVIQITIGQILSLSESVVWLDWW